MGFFFDQTLKAELYTGDLSDSLEIGSQSFEPYFAELGGRPSGSDMMWVDLMTYLPDDILVKVDRMSMACSLEVRSPFLDHRVVEFMARVPTRKKFSLRESKVLLRKVARNYLPEGILKRPKQGFAIPLAAWLRGELRTWMEDVLLSQTCRERGYFRQDALRAMVDLHLAGRRDYSQQLWALLVLESWFRSRP